MAATIPKPMTAVMIQGSTFSLTQYILVVIRVPRVTSVVPKWNLLTIIIKPLGSINFPLKFLAGVNKR